MNVTKIILTICQIFHLKCTKFNSPNSASEPDTGSSQRSPDLLAGFGEKGSERRKGESEREKVKGRK